MLFKVFHRTLEFNLLFFCFVFFLLFSISLTTLFLVILKDTLRIRPFSGTLSWANRALWSLWQFYKEQSLIMSGVGCHQWHTNINIKQYRVLYNGNWTEWSAIWSKIIDVIWKSREFDLMSQVWTRVPFEITSMISHQNCTMRSSITSKLLHPFWNHAI